MNKNFDINSLTPELKLDLSLEVINSQIAKASRDGVDKNSDEFIMLVAKKEEIYAGNQDVMNMVLNSVHTDEGEDNV